MCQGINLMYLYNKYVYLLKQKDTSIMVECVEK